MIWKVSRWSKKCPDHPENVAGLSKILQNHLLWAFVADLKIDAIYALHLESFCDKNLAIHKVFAFCDSAGASRGSHFSRGLAGRGLHPWRRQCIWLRWSLPGKDRAPFKGQNWSKVVLFDKIVEYVLSLLRQHAATLFNWREACRWSQLCWVEVSSERLS